jgi:hypothetical protein
MKKQGKNNGSKTNGFVPSSFKFISSCIKTASSGVRTAGASVAASISGDGPDLKDQVAFDFRICDLLMLFRNEK